MTINGSKNRQRDSTLKKRTAQDCCSKSKQTHTHTCPLTDIHTRTHTLTQSSKNGRGSPPLSVYIAAMLQSDKGEKGFITGLQLALEQPLVVQYLMPD